MTSACLWGRWCSFSSLPLFQSQQGEEIPSCGSLWGKGAVEEAGPG